MNNWRVITDPNDKFPDALPAKLLNACGFITQWVVSYFEGEQLLSLKEHLELAYGFGPLHPMQITIHPDDHLSYPGDPDLHPLTIFELNETPSPTRCIVYNYGIVAIIENGTTFITRMD